MTFNLIKKLKASNMRNSFKNDFPFYVVFDKKTIKIVGMTKHFEENGFTVVDFKRGGRTNEEHLSDFKTYALSKEEFLSQFPLSTEKQYMIDQKTSLCQCEFGTVPDFEIVERYSVENEFEKFLRETGCEFATSFDKSGRKYWNIQTPHDNEICIKIYNYEIEKNNVPYGISNNYIAKACLKCRTCVDEYDDMTNKFQDVYQREISKLMRKVEATKICRMK